MQKMAQSKNQIKVVDDQIGGPTWSKAIAEGTARILEHCRSAGKSEVFSHSGIFNMSCGGKTSWFGFAKKIFELSGKDTELISIPTIQYPTPAARPENSLLSNRKLKQVFHHEMSHWQDALLECLDSDHKARNALP